MLEPISLTALLRQFPVALWVPILKGVTFLILLFQSIRNRCDPVHLTHNRFFY